MCVQQIGGYSVHQGMFSTWGDIMSTLGMFSTSGDIIMNVGGYHVHIRDVQYIGD